MLFFHLLLLLFNPWESIILFPILLLLLHSFEPNFHVPHTMLKDCGGAGINFFNFLHPYNIEPRNYQHYSIICYNYPKCHRTYTKLWDLFWKWWSIFVNMLWFCPVWLSRSIICLLRCTVINCHKPMPCTSSTRIKKNININSYITFSSMIFCL